MTSVDISLNLNECHKTIIIVSKETNKKKSILKNIRRELNMLLKRTQILQIEADIYNFNQHQYSAVLQKRNQQCYIC